MLIRSVTPGRSCRVIVPLTWTLKMVKEPVVLTPNLVGRALSSELAGSAYNHIVYAVCLFYRDFH